MARILHSLLPALRQHLWCKGVALVLAVAFACGWSLGRALNGLLPSAASAPPYAAIAASVVLDLACLALLLIWLPRAAEKGSAWTNTAAWLGSTLAGLAALAGLSLSGGGEPLRTFAVLGGLLAAQGAVLAAVYGWLAVLFRFEPRLAPLVAGVVLSLAATALFWSREPIQLLGHEAEDGASSAAWLAEAVVAGSPPLAVASVWHQESAAARGGAGAGGGAGAARFDIIRAPLTYEVWLGSYRAVPYPQILPGSGGGSGGGGEGGGGVGSEGFRFGLVAGLLLPGLLLLLLSDIAAFFSRRTPALVQCVAHE